MPANHCDTLNSQRNANGGDRVLDGGRETAACFAESCPGGGVRGPVAVALGRVVRGVGTRGTVDLNVSQRDCGSLCIFVV